MAQGAGGRRRSGPVPEMVRALMRRFPAMTAAQAHLIAEDSLHVKGRRGVWFRRRLPERDRAWLMAEAWARHHATDYDARAPDLGGWSVHGRGWLAARMAVAQRIEAVMARWEGAADAQGPAAGGAG